MKEYRFFGSTYVFQLLVISACPEAAEEGGIMVGVSLITSGCCVWSFVIGAIYDGDCSDRVGWDKESGWLIGVCNKYAPIPTITAAKRIIVNIFVHVGLKNPIPPLFT